MRWKGHKERDREREKDHGKVGRRKENIREARYHLGRLRCTREDNIKTNLKETGHENVNLINLAHENKHWWVLVNTVNNLRVPSKATNFYTSLAVIGFTDRTPPRVLSQPALRRKRNC